MKKHSLKRQVIILIMLLFNQILLSQIFQEKQRDILGIEDGTLQLGDCDNDGDLDILVAGYSRELNYSTARIYENDGNGSFIDSQVLLPVGSALKAAWGDYDNDGDLDILIFTNIEGRLYRNDGDFNFSLISQSFPGLSYSVVKWIDIDNNGSLDIFISGYIGWSGDPISSIYINKGNDLFEESQVSFKACTHGDSEWADFNKDSYPDLLMTGRDINGNKHNTLYINNRDNTFTETNLYSSSMSYSECEWGDYDGDGDLDILLGDFESILLRNNNNVFSNSDLILPPDMSYKIAHWGDYDNDGDLDILFSGIDRYTNERISKLYQRNDDGTYNDTEEELFGSWMSLIAWGDLNNDGDLDLIISGQVNNDSTVTIIYENLLNTGNEVPTIPTGLYSIDGNNVKIGWKSSTDPETPKNSITYNIAIGNATNNHDILSPMSDTLSGFHLITTCGNTNQDTTWILKNLPEGTYYWKVQTLDNVFQASEFSVIDTFTVLPAYSIIELSSTGMSNGSISIGDYDNDLDLDILVKGEDPTYETNTKLFRNDGDMVFSDLETSFIGLALGGSDWGDYDNDGDLDLVYTGITNTDNYGVNHSLLYRNDGNGIFTELQSTLPPVNGGNIKWGDFNNDGYLDIILTGRDIITYKDSCRIFKNTENGFRKIPASIIPGNNLTGNFADLDNDGYLDISITGYLHDTYTYRTLIYRNDNSAFNLINNNIIGTVHGSSDWGDFDNDGLLDFLVTGSGPDGNNYTRIYRNKGNLAFEEFQNNLRQINSGEAYWADYNNNGYSDIILSGMSGNSITKLYDNNYGNDFTERINFLTDSWNPNNGKFAIGDLDNDGDLDIVAARRDKVRIIRNNENIVNYKPNAPDSLKETYFKKGIILDWSPASDKFGQDQGLNYNVRVGTTPGEIDIVSPMSDPITGYRFIPEIGNSGLALKHYIDSLSPGTYYWSVQAIDQSFAGGEWANEKTFEMSVLRADFNNDTACYGNSTHFYDQSVTSGIQITDWYWDFDDGSVDYSPNPEHLYTNSGVFNVKLIVNSSTYTDSITKSIIVKSKPSASFSANIVCQGIPVTATNTTDNNSLTISSWSWDFGDGSTSADQQPSPHPYLTAGDYSIKLRAVASNGCADSVTNIVSVGAYPVAAVTANAPLTFCKGDSVTLSVPYVADYLYTWKVDGTNLTDGDSSRYVAKLTGNYSVEIVNPKGNCTTNSSAVSITAQDAPAAPLIYADGDLEFCQGDSVILSVTNTAGYIYQWKLNGGAVGSDSSRYTAKSSGTYSLTVSNSTGCAIDATNEIDVTVYPAPTLPTVNLSGSTTFCEGDSVELSVTYNPDFTYQWENNSSIITGAESNSYKAVASGTYKLKISNSYGCITMTSPVDVTVKPMPYEPVITSDNYKAGECMGETPIKLNVEQEVPGYSYQWYRNGIPVAGETSSYIEDSLTEGDYSLEADLDGCTTVSDVVSVYFEDAPDKPSLHAQGPTVWYLVCSDTTGLDYRWYCNGNLIDGADDYYYIAGRKMGDYQVSIGNELGCFTRSDIVTIPKGDVGIDDVDPFEGLKIYPNPTTGLFTIEMDNNIFGELKLKIITENGKEVISLNLDKTTEHFLYEVDLSGQPQGLYIINLLIDKYLINKKIIVE